MYQLMAILNVTPDSFYDGGKYFDSDQAIQYAYKLKEDGADILDIGGASSRPFSKPVSVEEELQRTLPVIKAISKDISIPISIDTTEPEVAEKAIDAGATIINDINGLENPQMRKLAIETGVQVCIMHKQGTPETMQLNPYYPQGIIAEIYRFFESRIAQCLDEGMLLNQIILDPGIGFGKTVDHNVSIIQNLSTFQSLKFPLLIGLSRKSFLSKILDELPANLLAPTITANTLALVNGASIIRVHDVAAHRQVMDTLDYFNHAHEKVGLI